MVGSWGTSDVNSTSVQLTTGHESNNILLDLGHLELPDLHDGDEDIHLGDSVLITLPAHVAKDLNKPFQEWTSDMDEVSYSFYNTVLTVFYKLYILKQILQSYQLHMFVNAKIFD